jgi:gamma-glutamyltranspeptidase/glutathione hydrolase
MKKVFLVPALLALTGCSLITEVPHEGEGDLFASIPPPAPTATGRGGAASTVDVRATLAAIEILKHGGNAVDAAVAAAAVLGVTDPFSCGIGGGGFMLIRRADGSITTIDHRETAPAGFDAGLFYEGGAPIDFAELVTSGISVGVPGTVRGWDEALRGYGSLGLGDVLKRAILVAKHGFDVDQSFFDQETRNVERFRQITSTSQLYLNPEGEPFPIGTIFTNPDLAETYRLIAEGGAEAFYEGEIAQAIVDTVASPPAAPGATPIVRPGPMQLPDLAGYKAIVRAPVESSYREYTLYGMDAPSSGGMTVAMILNLLSGFDPAGLTHGEVLHRYVESSRLAYADRAVYMGDPDYFDVPREGLLSSGYADARRPMIDPTHAATAKALPGNPYAYQGGGSMSKGQGSESPEVIDRETTHIVVVDGGGNLVSYTCTIESEGGNGIVVPGYGFLLNNELTDFDIPAMEGAPSANAPEAGKRPRSSISPTLVMKDGAPVLTLGSPGGATIITTVTEVLVNYLDLGMPIDEALAAPRISQRNAGDLTTTAETAFLGTPEADELEALGHAFTETPAIGAATAIRFNDDGTVTAAAEPTRRNGGSAMVVEP